MKLSTSYRQILAISVPIMLGSAAQNIIVLSDNVFLYHLSKVDFAAVGLVGVFYLIVAAIGFGFSRGGQILIARKQGEGDYEGVGKYFRSLIYFEILMAVCIFLFLRYGSPWFFGLIVNNKDIYEKCIEYIIPRSYGVIFSYLGMCMIALYTGIARTKFIIIDTIILGSINLFLNYVLIFGKFGFPEMGIAGAGLASTIAEVVAFLCFLVFLLFDGKIKKYHIFQIKRWNSQMVMNTARISVPIVLQSAIGLGAWFIFFAMIENRSSEDLEMSNFLRNVYLILSIPCWGYSSAINTIASNFIGGRKRMAVIPMIKKTTNLNILSTILIALPVVVFPHFFLDFLFGNNEENLIDQGRNYLYVVFVILIFFSIGSTYINGLIGTGHTITTLIYQFLGSVVYLSVAYVFIYVYDLDLGWVWTSEITYWVLILILSRFFLKSHKWHKPVGRIT